MKKRIGPKLYDTDKGIPVIPEKNLYKQPLKRTFYLFDGKTITPVTFDQAADMIREAGDPDLLRYINAKPNDRGVLNISIAAEQYEKLAAYSRRTGISMKALVETFIDSLTEE